MYSLDYPYNQKKSPFFLFIVPLISGGQPDYPEPVDIQVSPGY
jgi:hypothetical protein